MRRMIIEIGKRYVVMSETSRHAGSVVTAKKLTDDREFVFVQPDEGNLFKLSTWAARYNPLRPAELEDEIRNLDNEKLNEFLDLVRNGLNFNAALKTATGIDVPLKDDSE